MSLRSVLFGAALVLAAACDKGPPRGEPQPATQVPTQAAQTAPTVVPATGAPVDPSVAKPAGTQYGAGVKLVDATSISAILADPQPFAGKTVRVEGMISDVCPKRGCWMEMAGDVAGDKLRFKVEDGAMVFPMDAKGKYAVAEGVVAVTQLTLEQTREFAEYQAKEYGKPYDPASITEGKRIVRLDGLGAIVRDSK